MPNVSTQPVNPSTSQYGLIGYPLTHSFSPSFFKEKFAREGINAGYEAFPLQRIEGFPALLQKQPQLCGLNVTTPHKQAVIRYLHAISEDAAAIGAVNCITIRDGHLYGHNTDWTAFRDSLLLLLKPHHTSALVLGSGGASQAVCYALRQMGLPASIVSRHAGKEVLSYEEVTADTLEAHQFIINTTTLGTLGVGLPALPYAALTQYHLLYDLVYNPPLTPFLAKGHAQGAVIKNGAEMLRLQAEASWAVWQRTA